MKYNLWSQHPEGSNVPLLNVPWKLVGSFEDDRKPEDVSIRDAVIKVTGHLPEPEYKGVWYMSMPADRAPAYTEQ